MKKYSISHMFDDEKSKNVKLYHEVAQNGKNIGHRWSGDYLVGIFDYNDKIYELWDNMEYGIMSEVIEYDKEEYKNERKDG